MSLVVVIAGCGARTPLLVDTSPSDGGSSPPADAEPNDSGPTEGGTDSTTGQPLDATTDSDEDASPPAEAAAPLRIVFFGPGGTYDEDALQAFLQAYPATVTRLATNSSPVSAAMLAQYDVVILDQVARSFDPSEAAVLAAWVQAGGSVMSLCGFANSASDWQQPDSLLADLPLQFNSTLYLATLPNGCPGDVTDIAMYPVTAGLHAVPFCGGFGVTVAGACDPIAFVQGSPVGAVCEQGAGRVYLWGDEWVEYSSTWVPGMDTQQFWQDAIDWLTHKI
jgi:hypothetical protein